MEDEHHPIFARFGRWEGLVDSSTAEVNWLGVSTSSELVYWQGRSGPIPEPRRVQPGLPAIHGEEYPEWIDLLEAAAAAGDRFTMVELGAGWGRWLVDGAFAYRRLQPQGELRLVGVEAEPTHFRWLREHVQANGIGAGSVDLVEAAVAGASGRVVFDIGNPLGWWGQAAHEKVTWRMRLRRRPTRTVRAITLVQALRTVDGLVDLIDLDVQGAEADVLTAGADELQRVRRVHIGTHGEEPEARLRTLFTGLGWVCQSDYPAFSQAPTTWWGGVNVSFQDGVQSWLNPNL